MNYGDRINHQSQYVDPADAFVPYDTQHPHGTYDQGGYHSYTGGYTDDPVHPSRTTSVVGPANRSVFDPDEYPAPTPRPKGPNGFNAREYESHENLWSRGGKARCCGRFFCCSLMTVVFLVVSIVLAMILWVRPPNVIVGALYTPLAAPGTTPAFNVSTTGINLNLAANISVENPNFFSVNFPSIKVQLYYPINNTAVGGGQQNNVNIRSNQQTNFTLPFSLQYNLTSDPSHQILTDITNKCTASQSLTVNYSITLGIRVIFFTISPVISNSASFACPLTAADVAGIVGSGVSLGG